MTTRSRLGLAIALSFSATVAAILAVPGCIGTAACDALRDRLLAQRSSWDACEADDDCVRVAGEQADCTGVFRCPFAVNVSRRVEAERAVLHITSQSAVCDPVCASPSCAQGEGVRCDTRSRRCMLVVRDEAPDAPSSPPETSTPQPDAGAITADGAP